MIILKKVIPFKKELPLDNKIYELSSISLEHEILQRTSDLISGEFLVSGSYKISPTSIEKENFEFTLPFDIAIDSRYDVDNMVIDIEDFYYEIIDNSILKVNIDLYLDGEIILDEKMENVDDFEDDDVTIKEEMIEDERCIEKEDDLMEDGALGNDVINEVKKTYEEIMPDREDININNDNDNTNINLFDDFSSSDTYATYHVYVVKEEDTLDTILNKYEISKEDLESYNNISDIKKGDKLIIPKNVQ